MTSAIATLAPPRAAVSIVVLSWNSTDDTVACLSTLCPQLAPDDRVIVVDNGSTDDVKGAVLGVDPRTQFIQNGANLGFAEGNNVGLRVALETGTPWILVLNNDTLLDADTLDQLLLGAEDLRRRCPEIGVVQPVLVRADAPDTIDSCGQFVARYPGAHDLAAGQPVASLPAEPVAIFGACGAAALVRREVLLAAGLFDADLFVLFEDTDLAFRVRAAGYQAALLPAVRLRHKRGVSGRRGQGIAARRRTFWVQRNTVTIGLRWWPTSALLLGAPLLAFRMAQAWLLQARHGFGSCASLWWRSLRQRMACRRRLRAALGDAWFGHCPATSRDRAGESTSPGLPIA